MIDFEEELKKFRPSMELEQVEDAVYNKPLTDMTDIMLEMMKREKENADNAAVAMAAGMIGAPLE